MKSFRKQRQKMSWNRDLQMHSEKTPQNQREKQIVFFCTGCIGSGSWDKQPKNLVSKKKLGDFGRTVVACEKYLHTAYKSHG